MASFSSILDKPPSEVKFPKLPVGTYVGIVKGMPEYGKSSKKGTAYVQFNIQITEAGEDVDPDELAEFGEFGGKELPITFYYESAEGQALEYGFNQMKAFLDNCGVENEGSTRSQLEQAPGKTVMVKIKHEASQDGQSIREVIDETGPYGE